MDMKDCNECVFDVEKTAFSNIPFLIFVLLIGTFILKGFVFLNTFESDDTRLLGLIVFMFSVVKLIGWVGLPNLEYKPRE